MTTQQMIIDQIFKQDNPERLFGNVKFYSLDLKNEYLELVFDSDYQILGLFDDFNEVSDTEIFGGQWNNINTFYSGKPAEAYRFFIPSGKRMQRIGENIIFTEMIDSPRSTALKKKYQADFEYFIIAIDNKNKEWALLPTGKVIPVKEAISV